MTPGPRLIAAIKAVLPLLNTQYDDLPRPTAVSLVYHSPLTAAQKLRKEADELDQRDLLIMELRTALREHEAIAAVRKEHGMPET